MAQLLSTKLFTPSIRQELVSRPRLIERMNEGLLRTQGVTFVSAPAGFGKTTLVSDWITRCGRPAAWLSLDEGDNDPARFLAYFVAALQTIAAHIGEGVLGAIQSPQLPTESILTALINEIANGPDNFVLVLDDYHVIDSKPVDHALTFLLEHLPPQMHLVIITREDPDLPVSRLRVRGQLTELRARDLRFAPSETAEFLNQVMKLNISAEGIAALEDRTEGWIAGLQLAAISLHGHKDSASFIKSFSGNHRFVMDYLLEEVLKQQTASFQTFLLRTSILDRLSGPLCDAVLLDSSVSGQEALEYLERANLFIIPLDNERCWYRYHHLFADLLRQRLHQSTDLHTGDERDNVAKYHKRASQWYEANGLEIEAFQHAAAANDVERAERLIEGNGVPLHFRGAGVPVLHWLESLSKEVLNARPSLWMTYASALMMTGQQTAVEEKLQAAEAALTTLVRGTELDDKSQDLIGQIASMRATIAVMQHDVETLLIQSRRALEYLHPDNLPLRTATTWTLGYAYQLQGERDAARQTYAEVISISKMLGPSIYTTAATLNLGQVQEADNQLSLAAETYRQAILLAGDPPRPIACEAHLGLARIYYQWNDLDSAEQHVHQCIRLTRQIDSVDTFAAGEVFLAHLKLAEGDLSGTVALLDEAEEFARHHNFTFRLPDVTAARVLALLRQGNLAKAAHLAETNELPFSLARVRLTEGDPVTALALLEPLRQQAESKCWKDEQLKIILLQAVALHAQGEKDKAAQLVDDVLALAEPSGFVRIFVDEGPPMLALLRESTKHRIVSKYVHQLIAAFRSTGNETPVPQRLIEPLSERELEVLKLLGTELNGPEIARGLMVSLNTMRTHTKNIYSKLGVNNRRAAARRAEELNLL